MRRNSKTLNRIVAAVMTASALIALPSLAVAEGLAGSWRGNGSVVLPSGATEKARCRVSFSKQGGRSYAMNAVCASSSVRVSQTASLQQVGANRFVGEFINNEYGITGSINLTLSGSSVSAALHGGGGSAFFNLNR